MAHQDMLYAHPFPTRHTIVTMSAAIIADFPKPIEDYRKTVDRGYDAILKAKYHGARKKLDSERRCLDQHSKVVVVSPSCCHWLKQTVYNLRHRCSPQ